jgi:hypothetical protein
MELDNIGRRAGARHQRLESQIEQKSAAASDGQGPRFPSPAVPRQKATAERQQQALKDDIVSRPRNDMQWEI